jgi:catechol 2,3-dioxygenase-like lactoylglutathione lyase family enzyme
VRIWYHVRDLAAARAFYRDVLGFTETFVDEDERWATLDRDETEIALTEGEPSEEEGGVATIDDADGNRIQLAEEVS